MKKLTIKFALAFTLVGLSLQNLEASSKLRPDNEFYANVVKNIMIKNELAKTAEDVTDIRFEYRVASLADALANISENNKEAHDRFVYFRLQRGDIEYRLYRCGFRVVIENNEVSGADLSTCTYSSFMYQNISL